MKLNESGFEFLESGISTEDRATLRDSLFTSSKAGTRCLLDDSIVQSIAIALRSKLVTAGLLPPGAIAIRAIAFNKTADTNWKVSYTQIHIQSYYE